MYNVIYNNNSYHLNYRYNSNHIMEYIFNFQILMNYHINNNIIDISFLLQDMFLFNQNKSIIHFFLFKFNITVLNYIYIIQHLINSQ